MPLELPDPATLEPGAPAYYRRIDDEAEGARFRPTLHVQGAWQPGEQHMAAISGLLVHELERHLPRPELRLARISFDILGVIPAAETTIAVRILRPGRTIELLEATATIGGRPAVRATAWRLQRGDTAAIAGHGGTPLPPPEQFEVHDVAAMWPGGYIASLEFRPGPRSEPGAGITWLRSRPVLVADEPISELARLAALVDTANGSCTRVDPRRWMFPNTDLGVHLFREPSGGWLGLDTQQDFGPDGIGLTSSVLHDRQGPFGRSEQILTVRPLP